MKIKVTIKEVQLSDAEAWVDLPDGTRHRVALSLREHIEIGGGWKFSLPVSDLPFTKSGQRIQVDFREFAKRDQDNTYFLLNTSTEFDQDELKEVRRLSDKEGNYFGPSGDNPHGSSSR